MAEAHELGEGQPPPHDTAAEAAVLSAVLTDGETALSRVIDFLHPEHFYSEAHRRIYEAALAVREAGQAIDIQTIGSRLHETRRLAQVGHAAYLVSIVDSSPTPKNIRDHAIVVYDRWRARQVLLVCRRAAAQILGGVADVQPFADDVTRSMAEIARRSPGATAETNIETLIRTVKMLHEIERDRHTGRKPRGIPYGIRAVDDATLGLHAGQKITIVAPPRVGKTAFALQVAITVAKQRIGVAFFSTEMLRDELADRQLAYLARVDSMRILQAKQKPTLTADEWRKISFTMSDAEQINYVLRVYDEPSVTVEEICARAKAQAEQSVTVDGVPLGLVVVDYVQNLRPSPGFEHRKKYEQVAHATVALKNLASELRIPVLELAQQKNSEVDRAKGTRPRPQLGDAAEAFQIERHANVVMYLWRPQERDGRNVKLMVVKQRGLKEAEVDLTFEQEFSCFRETGASGPMTSPSRQYVADPNDDGFNALTDGL